GQRIANSLQRLEVHSLREHGALPREHDVVRRSKYRRRFGVEQAGCLFRVEGPDVDTLTLRGAVGEKQEVPAVRQELRVTVAEVRCLDLCGGHGPPAAGGPAVQPFGPGAGEQDRAPALSGAAPRIP